PIINEPGSGVRAINATGSIFATFNSAYTIDSSWEWKKWNDKHNAYHFVTENRDKTHGDDASASFILALNDQGNVAGGYSNKTFMIQVPTIWKWQSGKWSEPIELPYDESSEETSKGEMRGLNGSGTQAVGNINVLPNRRVQHYESDYNTNASVWTEENGNWSLMRLSSETSSANAVNNKGDIVAGYDTVSAGGNYIATIWRFDGTTWSSMMIDDKRHYSEVFALNNAGDVAGGSTHYRPAIWSGNNYQKTELKGVDGNITQGEVRALSADGKIAGGKSKVGENYRATIWSGNDWKAYDLGTFKKDGVGNSLVTAMNDDGTIVGGEATFEDGESYAALWFIQYDENNKPTIDLLTNE
ncbi:hypothetical protein, partial [Ursidibacter arcticus]|uniref:hypothetical protein n=1 Tax=Ursidibacter arcticus TaxID=1524965 RepID=UPI001967E0D1